MRNIALIDRCFDGMIYGRQQGREDIRKEKTDSLSKTSHEGFGVRYITNGVSRNIMKRKH